SRFSLPPCRYFIRQYFAPVGITSRYIPPPSVSLYGLARGAALRTAVSVRVMGASRPVQRGHLLLVPPNMPPKWFGLQYTALDGFRRCRHKKPRCYAGLGVFFGLRWTS